MFSLDPFSRDTRRTPWLALVMLGTLPFVASCGHDDGTSFSFSHTSVDSEGGAELTVNGVRIECDDTVHYVYHGITSSGSSPGMGLKTINGNKFGLRENVFFIGEREYGTVASGGLVQVSSDGVTVDGEARGALPESRLE